MANRELGGGSWLSQSASARKARSIGLALLLILASACDPSPKPLLATSGQQPVPPASEIEASGTPSARPSGAARIVEGKLQSGQSLYQALLAHEGVRPGTVDALLAAAAPVRDLARVRPGERYSLALDGEGELLEYRQWGSALRSLVVRRRDERGLSAEIEEADVEGRRRRASGRVDGSLWQAATDAGIAAEMVIRLTDVFAWQIDFLTETRPGDSFDLLWEELVVDGAVVGTGELLAARYVNRGRIEEALRYQTTEGEVDYFDAEGRSRRLQFLRSPLNYRRISSGFSRSRLHPILKRVTPHLGIDFAADRGTPVVASGEGKVVFAGRRGPNGNMVEIRHGSIYRTYYLHLGSFARGVRNGAEVSQGQTIGFVGSSGRSTGPHLDYRMKRHDTFVNPLKETFREVRGVPEAEMARFADVRGELLAELDGGRRSPASATHAAVGP